MTTLDTLTKRNSDFAAQFGLLSLPYGTGFNAPLHPPGLVSPWRK